MPSGRIEHGTIDSPEIVTEVNDSNQWEIQDSAGNVIARFDQDQVVNLFSDLFDAANTQTVYDSSMQEVKADVNNTNTTAEVITLDQAADDGTDRVVIKKTDGTEMAELYSDGTNTVINPLSGNVDVQGALATESATISGGDGIGVPASSSSVALSLDSWRTPSASRPVYIFGDVKTVTDGSTPGWVDLQVDEGGGTSADYNIRVSYADEGMGSGAEAWGPYYFLIPPGASYQLSNASDPSGGNSISDSREFEL